MTREALLHIAKPILFNTEMVRATLRKDNPKTVTRRVIKFPVGRDGKLPNYNDITPDKTELFNDKKIVFKILPFFYYTIKPPYFPRDILYVRETWHPIGPIEARDYVYKADDPLGSDKWYPSIHMPKKAARIFLRVTGVHVERLQDIDGYGVLAEGVDNGKSNPAIYFTSPKSGEKQEEIPAQPSAGLSESEEYSGLMDSLNNLPDDEPYPFF